MKIDFKCLPYGDLPYESVDLTTKMMVKLFEDVPFLPQLSKMANEESLYQKSLSKIPGVYLKDKKIIFKNTTEKFKKELLALDIAFNTPIKENLERFKFSPIYLERYFQVLKRIQPAETVVNLLGPFTISQLLMDKDSEQFLIDKANRKLVVQAVCVKALWIIQKIKEISPNTLPVIMLQEPLLYQIGNIKRESEEVTSDIIVNMLAKTFQKIKENHGAVGVQCFEKCDWQIPIDAGVDIISFDAFNNPNNLSIIAEKINNFLVGGGKINWAIVPVNNESVVKNLNIDFLYDKFIKTVEGLIDAGVSERLAYNRSMVSVNGHLDKLPIIFAEKALILSTQLSRKIPFKN